MANSLARRPWIIDTPTLFDLCTGTFVAIHSIRWVGGTTAGHAVQLVDGDSNVIWESRASGANYVEAEYLDEEATMGHSAGFRASALQSGVVYVYYA